MSEAIKDLLTDIVNKLNNKLEEQKIDSFYCPDYHDVEFKDDSFSIYKDGYDGEATGQLELAEKLLILLGKKYER
jgi:hypothetical protein